MRNQLAFRYLSAHRLSALGLFTGFLLAFSPVGFVEQSAHASYRQQPVQELLQTDRSVSDLSQDTDYTIDQQPQYPPLDTQDVIDANDAEVTTPLAAFFFWLVMGAIAVGVLTYALLRVGVARAR